MYESAQCYGSLGRNCFLFLREKCRLVQAETSQRDVSRKRDRPRDRFGLAEIEAFGGCGEM